MALLNDLTGPRFTAEPACADHDPDLWWGDHDDAGMLLALTVCQGCPVQRECLDHALTHPEREGIWGGTMPSTRKRMLAQRRQAVA